MNLNLLHATCSKQRLLVSHIFKNQIENAVFKLDDYIIDVELNEMRNTFLQKVFGTMYKNGNLSEMQHTMMEKIALDYINPVLSRGKSFAEDYKLLQSHLADS